MIPWRGYYLEPSYLKDHFVLAKCFFSDITMNVGWNPKYGLVDEPFTSEQSYAMPFGVLGSFVE